MFTTSLAPLHECPLHASFCCWRNVQVSLQLFSFLFPTIFSTGIVHNETPAVQFLVAASDFALLNCTAVPTARPFDPKLFFAPRICTLSLRLIAYFREKEKTKKQNVGWTKHTIDMIINWNQVRCTYQKEGLLCGLYSLVGLDALRDSVISSLQIRYEGTQPVALLKPRGACFRYASFQKKWVVS